MSKKRILCRILKAIGLKRKPLGQFPTIHPRGISHTVYPDGNLTFNEKSQAIHNELNKIL